MESLDAGGDETYIQKTGLHLDDYQKILKLVEECGGADRRMDRRHSTRESARLEGMRPGPCQASDIDGEEVLTIPAILMCLIRDAKSKHEKQHVTIDDWLFCKMILVSSRPAVTAP